ncbi:hypothetical protein MMC30_005893 [Trapelia coarctata]|nr:hypothetical protein [Trapelia coarctata]
MADTQVWSRLPSGLIGNNLMNTDDPSTLYSWRRTCKGLRDLVNRHPALTYTLWEAHFRTSHRHEGKHPGVQLFTRDAAFYRELRLYFQFGAAPYHTEAELVASQEVKAKLSVVIPSMKQLRELYHNGILYQDFLELIANKDSLTRLMLRGRCVRKRGQCHGDDTTLQRGMPPRVRSDLLLDFGLLEKLAQLQVLRIANLLPGEGRNLGKAVQNLHSLKELDIAAASLNNAFH